MTNRVDRLVKRGLVTREQDPNDGRGVLVAITPDGSALVDAAMTSLLDLEQELLAGWTGPSVPCWPRCSAGFCSRRSDPAGPASPRRRGASCTSPAGCERVR
ncbi:MarR family winged helix-turn-helix transcriptional regulator [Tessaracoccus coleopterorum]|uniref:MarR family winged helix-turn-helix transcriptional regulator n=1 Tax=Tessaracoccus coleopterorum TaxID=2714950 RepID=UPI002F90B320